MKTHRQPAARDGALLVAVVIGLLAASLLGTAVLSMTTSAHLQRVHAAGINRAYYLAESGGAYARAVRFEDRTLLPAGSFTLSNGDRFEVFTFREEDQVIVRSLGIANPGTNLESRRRLHFVLSDTTSDVLPVGFDFDEDGSFDEDTWNTVNVDPRIRTTGPSGRQPALDLRGEQGHISLNWQDHPELNLLTLWGFNGGLLSYDAQVKVKPFDTGQQAAYSKHYMLGLSFRMHQEIEHSYGLSFFRSHAGTVPGQTPSWVTSLPPSFQALRGDGIYLVLWYRHGGLDSLDLLNYRLLTAEEPVVEIRNDLPELVDYSTMLLELKERFTADGRRENQITAYTQGTSVYPLWTTRDDMEWQENTAVFPEPVRWQDGTSTVTDSRLTTEEFPLLQPSEVGIHVLYDRTGANLKFFDDFALRMEGYGALTEGQIQY